ncbi:hypothetical protein [Paractinoplanes durhamensis]|uniref:hypothetical protein n=1 Tax=Paractinoplanes durhamensis TaxID=113563 RepID=UPI00363F13BD
MREVQLLLVLEGLPLLGGDRRAGQQRGVRRVEVAVAGQRAQRAVHPDHRRGADGQVQVGAAHLAQGDQHLIEHGQIARRGGGRCHRRHLLLWHRLVGRIHRTRQSVGDRDAT